MDEVPNARQILRWLIRDNHTLTPGLDAFLFSALQDVDWELRASAMVAVGLFQAWHHLPLIARLEWRKDARNGPTRIDAEILRVWHAAILDRARVHRTDPRDHETMLLYALLNPLEGVDPATHPHKPGHRFVPPVPHWIGDQQPQFTVSNPIRRFQYPTGFWISERPCGESTFEAALEFAAVQSRRSGVRVRLPSPEEWEMAARGSDARFFPWGNGYQPDAGTAASPWGLEGLMASRGEWCITGEGNFPVLCGNRNLGLGARRVEFPADLLAGYRLIVEL